ncbi:MAG: transposase [Hyphomicrobiales bacterium]|nr:transposase [Hyphomicrobiales bacterium]
MPLRKTLTACWQRLQGQLFPWLEEELGPLGDRHRRLVTVLDVVGVEAFLPYRRGGAGCPPSDRAALARAFVAKAVFNLPTTGLLIERLSVDKTLRRLCGWERLGSVPSESTFSRAFAEFARSALPSRLHQALIESTHAERLVGHVSRDSTAIERARSRRRCLASRSAGAVGRAGRGGAAARRRLERQLDMTLEEMLADLPRHCAVGTKRSAKGYRSSWTGYKLHLDVADGMVPLSALLSAASLHDSQAAIPLATLTAARRVRSLYDLMDSAYDVGEIKDHSRSLGHVPIIEANPWGKAERKRNWPRGGTAPARRIPDRGEDPLWRAHGRRAVNARLKDDFGGRTVRVRGHDKVMCHLMFGILALTVDQLMRLVP